MLVNDRLRPYFDGRIRSFTSVCVSTWVADESSASAKPTTDQKLHLVDGFAIINIPAKLKIDASYNELDETG